MEIGAYEWLWGCCCCPSLFAGTAGLTKFYACCPECGHERCFDCQWERRENLFDGVQGNPASAHSIHPKESRIGSATNKVRADLDPMQNLTRSQTWSRGYQEEAKQTEHTREKQRPRRRTPTKHGSNSTTASGKTFACHFCKRSPQVYNPWTRGDKYLKCLRPRLNDLRRIKDHFNRVHVLPYFRCRSCYTVFEDEKDLICHEDSFATCQLTSATPTDGIDKSQMKQIDVVLSARTDKWKSDSEKWFDIWTILFPGARPPKSPYSESPVWSPADILTEIEYTVELKYELGLLKRDEQSHRTWIDIIKEALDTVLDVYQEAKSDVQSAEDIVDMLDSKQFECNDFCHEADRESESAVKEHRQDPAHDLLKADTLSSWEFDDFVHSSPPMDLQGDGSPTTKEPSFSTLHLPPPIKKWSVTRGGKTKTNVAYEYDGSLHAQEPIYMNQNSNLPQINRNIGHTQRTTHDSSDFISIPKFESRADALPGSTTCRPFLTSTVDCDTSFPIIEDDLESGVDFYIDTYDIGGLLAFESRQPTANGPISHIRDMNKGLKGRYEFDGSM